MRTIKWKIDEYVFYSFAVSRAKYAAICAGDGYSAVCSIQKAFPVDKRFNELGYHTIMVNYRTGRNARYPNPQDDLAATIRFTWDHANAWNINFSNYALVGFSAGDHLAASFCSQKTGHDRYSLPLPGALILGYPVLLWVRRPTAVQEISFGGKES